MPDEPNDELGTPEANPKHAWTIKNLPPDRREAITRAARRNSETVAEFVWAACETRIQANRAAPSAAPSERELVIPEMATGQTLVELFELVRRFAGTAPTKGNRALMNEARAVLRGYLRRARQAAE